MPPRPDLGPKPRLGYTHSRIERAAELRPDNAAMARLASQPDAGAYVIGGDWIAMKKGAPLNDPLFTMDEARALGAASDTVFLGLLEGAARFGYGISGAYRCSEKAPDYVDVMPLAQALVKANPDRIVWGTDWPHPNSDAGRGKPLTDITAPFPIDDGLLFNQMAKWVPDAGTRKKILVDNPAGAVVSLDSAH
jgi:Amidohydrolase